MRLQANTSPSPSDGTCNLYHSFTSAPCPEGVAGLFWGIGVFAIGCASAAVAAAILLPLIAVLQRAVRSLGASCCGEEQNLTKKKLYSQLTTYGSDNNGEKTDGNNNTVVTVAPPRKRHKTDAFFKKTDDIEYNELGAEVELANILPQ